MTNRLIMAGVLGAAGLSVATTANAAIVFSNISVTGSLSPASAITGSNDIDFVFNFPAGTVGDPVDPLRAGSVTIMFDATSDAGGLNSGIFSFLGAALGSGAVSIDLVVDDLVTPGTIASVSGIGYNAANPPPTTQTLTFSRATTSFHVMATITAIAPDTPDFDMAQLSLMESRFVPAPGALAAMLMGGVVLGRRRR